MAFFFFFCLCEYSRFCRTIHFCTAACMVLPCWVFSGFGKASVLWIPNGFLFCISNVSKIIDCVIYKSLKKKLLICINPVCREYSGSHLSEGSQSYFLTTLDYSDRYNSLKPWEVWVSIGLAWYQCQAQIGGLHSSISCSAQLPVQAELMFYQWDKSVKESKKIKEDGKGKEVWQSSTEVTKSVSFWGLSNNGTETNCLFRAVSSAEGAALSYVCLDPQPWSDRRWEKRSYNKNGSHSKME